MYEVDRFRGNGKSSAFFGLKGHPNIGVLIKYFGDSGWQRRTLERELKWGKSLVKLGISVPKYIGFIQVKIPENIDEIFRKNPPTFAPRFNKELVDLAKPGKVFEGIAVQLIENDIALIGEERIIALYNHEMEKLKSYGIKPNDSNHRGNVLYSAKRNKLYLIDFEGWKAEFF